ncbi:LOW QUALITY PROTEIN: adenylyltransferase and sulfurtransferase MOCS3-like [Dermacentor silvarum]|uniref:LOW QUALITY PROTEIN: adenylyltransferase and sulfurtransferase MOCS3-like n=1 Tax=Dermacentor silvarum TaxID=543639 RepID=UPI001897D20B|nr:LOW QUALITY PROTEIN: adenylyltransferase and sulfurtransferase MOCS3-like [Dermacentor silvarum]
MDSNDSEIASLRAQVEAKDAEIERLRRALSREQALSSVIDAALNKDDVSRYSRQMLLPGFGVQGQKALKSASVLIVGAGGLGCPCAAYLAAAGVGRIGIVDFDAVEKSNLHRQILHSEAKVGMSKVDSLVLALRQLNSQPEYVQHSAVLDSSNALDIIGRYQVVVDASDNAATRYLVNDACVHLGRPLVSGSALRWEGQLTVYGYRGGPCYRCLFPQPPPTSTVTNCSEGGVIGMVPGVIGCMQALEVVKILTGYGDVCSGKLLLFDGADARWRHVALRGKLPDCAVCANPSTAPAVQDYAAWCGTGPTNKCCGLSVLPKELRISCQDLRDRLLSEQPSCLLLDVRPKCQFEMCHLPRSINIPFEQLDNELDSLEKKLTENAEVVVICRRGNDSQLAVEKLRQAWNQAVKVCDVRGGLEAWSRTVDPDFPTY